MSVARSLLIAALLAIPHSSFAQIPWLGSKPVKETYARPVASSARALAIATVTESEPNDLVSQAEVVTLGDTASGTIGVTDDVDSYAVDLVAGTKVSLDVVAKRAGSPLDPSLTLLAPDGLTTLAFNDDYVDVDSHIDYFITATGRYFVQIRSFAGVGSAASTYSLSFGSVPAGPGDPPTLYAGGLGVPFGMAAGPVGELYVADIDALRVLRIAPNAQVTELATLSNEFPVGVVVDGFGDLLVSTVTGGFTAGRVLRISGGQRSTFAADLQAGAAITVGPDGDVWVIDPVARVLRHYDPFGTSKGSVSLASLTHFAFDMGLAFSPAGELFLSDGFDSIYKIVGGTPQRVFQGFPFLNGLAFDQDGFLYVANGALGRVTLLDPDLHVVHDPFARSYLSGPTQLVFLRGVDGAETSRLVADDAGIGPSAADLGGIIEANPAGVRAAGFRVGTDLLQIANATLRDGVVGADYGDTLRLAPATATATWSVASGALPPGLALSTDGLLTGIPTQAGAFPFSVHAEAGGQLGVKTYTVTVTIPAVGVAAAAEHLLGGAQLDLPLQRFLDLQGNQNGHFDIGDFRAFLRANGQLPAAAVAGKEKP